MNSVHETTGNGTTECLKRCEEALDSCISSGAASSNCDEIYNGCVTGCESDVVTD
jgi:hypothetical protein